MVGATLAGMAIALYATREKKTGVGVV